MRHWQASSIGQTDGKWFERLLVQRLADTSNVHAAMLIADAGDCKRQASYCALVLHVATNDWAQAGRACDGHIGTGARSRLCL
jgi:hypothetical protein